jgi:hypothetical protein
VSHEPAARAGTRPTAGALLVVAAALAVGPLGAVALSASLDRWAVAGVPLGLLAGQLLAPAALAALVACYTAAVNARERRGGGGRLGGRGDA